MQHLIILLASPGGTGNLGDVLLQRILKECLRSCGTLFVQRDSKRSRDSRAWRYREFLSTFLAPLTVAFSARINQDFFATLMLPPGQSLTKSLADAPHVATRLAYFSLMRVLGFRIVSLGRDFSSRTWIDRLQEIAFSHVAHHYTLRDSTALRRARSIGIRKAAWFPDLSWLVPAPQFADASAERTSLVLSFRSDTDHLRWDDRLASAILGNLDRFLEEARELGLRNVILVQHADQDQGITMQIEKKYQGKKWLRREPGLLSLAKVPVVYDKAALVLSNRLHSLLLGLQWGAVPLAVIHDSKPEKVRNQLLDINLAEHVVDLATPNLGRGIIERALRRRNAVEEAVAMYRLRAESSAHQTLAAIFNPAGRKGSWEDKIDIRVLYQQL